jgi:hypothetical protein
VSPSTIENDVATVGPENVDAPGDLAPKVVKQQEAHELINRVRANYPVELVIIEQRDEDRPRTKALVADEVLAAATDEFGDADTDGGIVRLLSARVRGKAQPVTEKAVCILWETPSGRTARGAFAYAPLSESVQNFDRMVDAGEVVEVDETDAKDLTRTVERQRDQISRLNARLAAGEAGDPTAGSGLTEDDVRQMIEDAIGDKAASAIAERDDKIAELEAELQGRDAGSPPPQAEQPETTAPATEDAADATGDGSKTEAELNGEAAADAGDGSGDAAAGDAAATGDGGEPAPPTPEGAPEGSAKVLIANMASYSDGQLEALAKDERSTVAAAATKTLQNRREG